MKRPFLIVVLLLFTLGGTYGQADVFPETRLTIGYFGETLAHPGLNLGIEFTPLRSERYQMILAAGVGGYIHKRNNTSCFIRGLWGQRVTFNNGIFIDEFIGLGYLHQFPHGGDLFDVLPNGAVVRTPNSGSPLVMPSVALGTGYDFSKKTKWSIVYFLRPELFWKAPFNGYYLTHLAINTGFILNISKKDEN